GYQDMELPGRKITTILELEPAQGWDSLCRDLHEGKVIKNAEKYFLHKKGAKIPVLFSASFLSAEGGIVCIAQDILELKRAEDEREKLAAAIEQARETVMIMGPDGAIQYVNQAIEKITGKTRQELIGHKIYLIVRYSEERYRDQFRQAWESITAGIPWLGTITEIKPDNSSIDLDLAITPVRDAQGAVSSIVSIGRDVTRERLLEAQLRQSQKMEAIGTLAGGIAHDFNNILAGILGFTEIVKDEVPQDSRAIYHLDQILKLGDRAVNLVRQILAFSRKAGSNRTPMQLSPLIKEVLNLLRATLPATIEMRQRLMDQGSIVEADPTQIHQVLMNLCTNAFHALQEKAGVLEVELTRVSLSREDIASDKDIEPGPYVLLKVSDTGEGIDQAIISRIFDPFFTTKDVGKGTGLGLSVVHGIIKAHGGDITVTSEPGKGTTFSILLPEVSAQGESKQEESSSEPLSGSEHILFVDDEEALSELAKELLEPFGYSVTAVQSGEEAIAIFQKAPEKFDLVITDLSMPHMTGYELAQELLRIKPGIPVILCTGNNETSSGIKEKDPNIKAVLAKPVNRNVLAETIRKVLNLF
ncbi:MAG: ATP-binding protein, partial [Pseudomonadota bacterium]